MNEQLFEEQLPLSPSEKMAHNSAVRISGGAKTGMATQKALASIVLGFELIIVVLIGVTLFGLSVTEPREWGLYIGGGLATLCVTGLVLMRWGILGVIVGHLVHVLMLATSFILPMAGIVGALFTGLWAYCLVKGSRIDRERAARSVNETSETSFTSG